MKPKSALGSFLPGLPLLLPTWDLLRRQRRRLCMDDEAYGINLENPPEGQESYYDASSDDRGQPQSPHTHYPVNFQHDPTLYSPSMYPQYMGQPTYFPNYPSPPMVNPPFSGYPHQSSWWYPTQPSFSPSGMQQYPVYNTYQDQTPSRHDAVPYPPSSLDYHPESSSTPRGEPSQDNTSPSLQPSPHPSRPSPQRTPWVMWVGNLPSRTTHEELQTFLTARNSDIVSIFVIPHSNCAFVNVGSQDALRKCIKAFDGKQLRPDNPRCPRLVCRIRTVEDEAKAGVVGQRMAHFHKDAIRDGSVRRQDFAMPSLIEHWRDQDDFSSSPPLGRSGSPSTNESTDSTSSSMLAQHFPERFFILKCFTNTELQESVKTGVWTTQVHNESTLNRAFRTSRDVFLFLSENGSGAFYGYAKMASGIGNASSKSESQSRLESRRLTPPELMPRASSEPADDRAAARRSSDSLASAGAQSLKSTSVSPTISHAAMSPPASSLDVKGKGRQLSSSDVPNQPTPFRIQWLSTERLPFRKTRHITNPWTEGREVKISRDGTELHPGAGKQLIEAWARLNAESQAQAKTKKRPGGGGGGTGSGVSGRRP
ncbi:YT521-B-like domain-containing protein [Flagelloscypha sp. PMI_526]|nr:YT521-B-like domain-containing protein [Flagelloscypha sp. PMI_526]